MPDWFLNPALTRFRAEVDARWPRRDRTSDGTIGDAAHQSGISDHNPDPDGSVDAWDMDNNLRTGNDDAVIYTVLIPAFQAHPASQYWIYRRQIASRSSGWRRSAYTGASPHTEHVHWNTRTQYENSTQRWLSTEDDMAAVPQDQWERVVKYTSDTAWSVGRGGPYYSNPEQNQAITFTLKEHNAVLHYLENTVGVIAAAVNRLVDDDIEGQVKELRQSMEERFTEIHAADEADARLAAADLTPQQKADLLRKVLGDDAKAVGELLAGG